MRFAVKAGDEFTFRTTYRQHRRLNGLRCKVVRVVGLVDDTHDAEVLPMYDVAMLVLAMTHCRNGLQCLAPASCSCICSRCKPWVTNVE
jgi:hypothetical protein